jgi:hypothetical protein
MFRLIIASFAIIVAIVSLTVFYNAVQASPLVQALSQEGR